MGCPVFLIAGFQLSFNFHFLCALCANYLCEFCGYSKNFNTYLNSNVHGNGGKWPHNHKTRENFFIEAAPITEGAHYALCDIRAAKIKNGQNA